MDHPHQEQRGEPVTAAGGLYPVPDDSEPFRWLRRPGDGGDRRLYEVADMSGPPPLEQRPALRLRAMWAARIADRHTNRDAGSHAEVQGARR